MDSQGTNLLTLISIHQSIILTLFFKNSYLIKEVFHIAIVYFKLLVDLEAVNKKKVNSKLNNQFLSLF